MTDPSITRAAESLALQLAAENWPYRLRPMRPEEAGQVAAYHPEGIPAGALACRDLYTLPSWHYGLRMRLAPCPHSAVSGSARVGARDSAGRFKVQKSTGRSARGTAPRGLSVGAQRLSARVGCCTAPTDASSLRRAAMRAKSARS